MSKAENRNSRFAFWIWPAYYFRGSIPDAKTPNHGGADSNAFAVHDAHKSLAFPTQNFAQQRSRCPVVSPCVAVQIVHFRSDGPADSTFETDPAFQLDFGEEL